ncbi:quinolinate synthase NadA [Defluviitalea phaphyphila]|uniref:quinolinate synthase NadA n=1 Tax=Defluviitalea phaphyphila TaxID=1473580 RepID=UPI0007307C31|nr:quinolinate synthase NadA [Defluviitalea phaphyphila]
MDNSLISQIKELKKKKNALILAHNYQREEIQNLADIVGDSFALSLAALNAKEDTIVFCGVRFMAETAKILCPNKKVLLPVYDAGCPMADMITAEELRKAKEKYPDAAVVCYVNSYAEVKAESDVCVTSSNAVKIIKSLKEKQILFIPDKNLGTYIGEKVPEKEILVWDGFCIVHHLVTAKEVIDKKNKYPNAEVLVHPECKKEVLSLADFIGSTSEIINYASSSDKKEFIIGTEKGVLTSLEKNNKDKKFYMLSSNLLCRNMKKTGLKELMECLKEDRYEIKLEEDILIKARKPLERMIEIAKRRDYV